MSAITFSQAKRTPKPMELGTARVARKYVAASQGVHQGKVQRLEEQIVDMACQTQNPPTATVTPSTAVPVDKPDKVHDKDWVCQTSTREADPLEPDQEEDFFKNYKAVLGTMPSLNRA